LTGPLPHHLACGSPPGDSSLRSKPRPEICKAYQSSVGQPRHGHAHLKLEGKWAHLQNSATFETFLAPLERQSWVTYIQPPPTESSQPQDIVKYLARYLTGGPISDQRLVKYEGGRVTFSARCGTTHGGNTVAAMKSKTSNFRRWKSFAAGVCTYFRRDLRRDVFNFYRVHRPAWYRSREKSG
jgi:Putative transposase